LGAGNTSLPPHLHNLIAVVESHDWFPTVGPNSVQQLAFNDVIGALVTPGSHIKRTNETVILQPYFGFLANLIRSAGTENRGFHLGQMLGQFDDVRYGIILGAPSKKRIPILAGLLYMVKAMRTVRERTVQVKQIAASHSSGWFLSWGCEKPIIVPTGITTSAQEPADKYPGQKGTE
jgi:hypothetical protein